MLALRFSPNFVSSLAHQNGRLDVKRVSSIVQPTDRSSQASSAGTHQLGVALSRWSDQAVARVKKSVDAAVEIDRQFPAHIVLDGYSEADTTKVHVLETSKRRSIAVLGHPVSLVAERVKDTYSELSKPGDDTYPFDRQETRTRWSLLTHQQSTYNRGFLGKLGLSIRHSLEFYQGETPRETLRFNIASTVGGAAFLTLLGDVFPNLGLDKEDDTLLTADPSMVLLDMFTSTIEQNGIATTDPGRSLRFNYDQVPLPVVSLSLAADYQLGQEGTVNDQLLAAFKEKFLF